jgi:hypothetical protein
MERFSEIDLWNLSIYSVDALESKNILQLYGDIINKLSDEDYKRIRSKEYWEIKDLCTKKYEKMKLLIYCYVADRDGEDIDWEHIRRITPDKRKKPSAIKPRYNEL